MSNWIELVCEDEVVGKSNQPAHRKTKSNYVAAAIVDKAVLKANLITEESIDEGGIAARDAVIAKVRELNRKGLAAYLPAPHINGSKVAAEDVIPSNATYGNRIDPKPDGTKRITIVLTYENYFTAGNVKYFNHLAKNRKGFDLILFTENTLSIIEDKDIDVLATGYNVAGNGTDNIDGTVTFRYISNDGEPVPYSHNSLADLQGYTGLTLATSTPTGSTITLALCSTGGCTRYNATYASDGFTGTIPFQVTETNTPCVQWKLEACALDELPAGISITQNGVVTFTEYDVATVTRYNVIAYTESGVFGKYCFEISAVAA